MACVLSACFCAFLLIQSTVAEDGPLERLRNRSAEKRWKTIRERIANRRESRRERLESRKTSHGRAEREGDEKTTSRKNMGEKNESALKHSATSGPTSSRKGNSQLPAVTPFTADTPTYFGQTRFKKQNSGKNKSKRIADKKESPDKQGSIDGIQLPMPVIQPSPLSTPKQVNEFPVINPLPVSQSSDTHKTRNVNTAFAPDLQLPGFKQNPPGLRSMTPEEIENRVKEQGLGSDYDEIKSIQSISPFVDYEPDKKLRKEDPGRHLCFPDATRPGLISNADVQCPNIEPLPESDKFSSRNFAHLDYTWKATNLHYYPLYFEDPNLERYGHIRRPLIQPIASVTRFNIQLLGLPYQMAMRPVSKCVYPLGHYRPGDVCAPKYLYQIPINPWAGLITAEIYTGLFFLIP